MVEVIEEKKPYWVVYVTQGQGEASRHVLDRR